jgi:hypothetical protein
LQILPEYLKQVMKFLSDLLMEMKRAGSNLAMAKGDWGECRNLAPKSAQNTMRDKFYETMSQASLTVLFSFRKVIKLNLIGNQSSTYCMR